MKLKDAAFYNNFEVFTNAILKRGKMMSSKFNEDEFFETEISCENYKILEGIILPSKISQKFAQNFETVLSLMLRLDPENPTRKLGWRSDEKTTRCHQKLLKFCSNRCLFKMFQTKFFMKSSI